LMPLTGNVNNPAGLFTLKLSGNHLLDYFLTHLILGTKKPSLLNRVLIT
jgi:hypothetical protein